MGSGTDFLTAIDQASLRCGEWTAAFEGGERLPATRENIGAALSYLYDLACCVPECRGGDHQVEWLVGRAVSQALAAIQLSNSGFYNESLSLTRGVGEIANLLCLLQTTGCIDEWLHSDRKYRLKNFSPVAVRDRLASSAGIVPVCKERYSALCEIGTHPVPWSAPGHFTGTGRPMLGQLLQPAGLMVCTNELALVLAFCCLYAGLLVGDSRPECRKLARDLVEGAGGLTILNYVGALEEVNGAPAPSPKSVQ